MPARKHRQLKKRLTGLDHTRREPSPRRFRRIPKPPPRPAKAHKGTFGRVLVIGGSQGMIGAPALVAQAALRSGAGLVTIACPTSIQHAVAVLCPCATSIPLPETRSGQIDPVASRAQMKRLGLLSTQGAPSVVAAGPGLGERRQPFARSLVRLLEAFDRTARIPIVWDADALNALSSNAALPANRSVKRALSRSILTPHPGEMARLLGITATKVQSDREEAARKAVRIFAGAADDPPERPVVVLKGARTIVTDGVHRFVNDTGNAGMATGGTGDVLTGVIAALVAQGMTRFDAAVLGVHLHGMAGDIAARAMGKASMIATDLIDTLPRAFERSRT